VDAEPVALARGDRRDVAVPHEAGRLRQVVASLAAVRVEQAQLDVFGDLRIDREVRAEPVVRRAKRIGLAGPDGRRPGVGSRRRRERARQRWNGDRVQDPLRTRAVDDASSKHGGPSGRGGTVRESRFSAVAGRRRDRHARSLREGSAPDRDHEDVHGPGRHAKPAEWDGRHRIPHETGPAGRVRRPSPGRFRRGACRNQLPCVRLPHRRPIVSRSAGRNPRTTPEREKTTR